MREAGHSFLARLGKTKLRPGGVEATGWLLEKANIKEDSKVLEVACNMRTTMIQVAGKNGCNIDITDGNLVNYFHISMLLVFI